MERCVSVGSRVSSPKSVLHRGMWSWRELPCAQTGDDCQRPPAAQRWHQSIRVSCLCSVPFQQALQLLHFLTFLLDDVDTTRKMWCFFFPILCVHPSPELMLQPCGLCSTRPRAKPFGTNQNTARVGGSVNPSLIYL